MIYDRFANDLLNKMLDINRFLSAHIVLIK